MNTTTGPVTAGEFLAIYRKSGLYDEALFRTHFPKDGDLPADARSCAGTLVRAGLLTNFQAKQLLTGRFRGLVLGTHRILQPIGQGGMGMVYLGEHINLKRKVAIKVLPSDKAKDKLTLERFLREARAAAALAHPNIVRLHDIGENAGVHYLVLEYVEGHDLQSLMTKTGPLHYAQAADYIAQAAAGLKHAHDKGIIHRDIKPANLILAKDGTVKLLDLGLARSLDDVADDLTAALSAGDVAGTADYVSPEQAMCEPTDGRADIYSLGATLYTLLAGHPPFGGSTQQKLAQHQMKDPPSLTKKIAGRIPPALAEVVTRMMAKRPADRYQTAEDVIEALAPWLPAPTSGPVAAATQSVGTTKTVRKRPTSPNALRKSRLPKWVFAAAAALLLAVGGGVALVVMSDAGSPPIVKRPAEIAKAPPSVVPPVEKQATTEEPSEPTPNTSFVRTPLSPEPRDERFTPISLASVANVSTNDPQFSPERQSPMILDDWSDRRVMGVPFTLVPPEGNKPNMVELYSARGLAANMPKSVTVPVNVAATQLHFLSGVGAWCYPSDPKNRDGVAPSVPGNVVMKVIVHYQSGETEEHIWKSAIHFCAYQVPKTTSVIAKAFNPPESQPAIAFQNNRMMRYLTFPTKRQEPIQTIEFIKNEDEATAPMILAITAER